MKLMQKYEKSPYFTTRTSSLKLNLKMKIQIKYLPLFTYSAKLNKLYETPIPM